MAGLETPSDWSELYDAHGKDVDGYRPAFTGDVYELPDHELVQLVQHPCALRQGPDLIQDLLVVQVTPQDDLPEDWSRGHFKIMPLPGLTGDSHGYAANFIRPRVISPGDLEDTDPLATMSRYGVNLLMQRWVYHNSRVAIPTITYDQQTVGPFEEAELCAEWCGTRVDAGEQAAGAMATFDTWIRQPYSSPDSPTRQEMLTRDQHRSTVRRVMRAHLAQ